MLITGNGLDLLRAVLDGQESHVESLLLDPHLNINYCEPKSGASALFLAIKYGHLNIVKRLLADPRINGNLGNKNCVSPLFLAVQMQACDVVKWLVDMPEIDIRLAMRGGHTMYYYCLERGMNEMIRELKKKINVQEDIKFALEHLNSASSRYQDACRLVSDMLADPVRRDLALQFPLLPKFVEMIPTLTTTQLGQYCWTLDHLSVIESAKKVLLELGAYIKVSEAVIKICLNDVNVSKGFRNVLSRSLDIRESVVWGCPELVRVILNFLIKTHFQTADHLISVSGIILSLAGLQPENAEEIICVLYLSIFPAIKNGTDQIVHALDCLMVAASTDHARKYLISLEVYSLLQPHIEDLNSPLNILCSLIWALLATESLEHLFGKATPRTLKNMLVALEQFAQTKKKEVQTSTAGYTAECWAILRAIRNLLTDEDNLKPLTDGRIAKILVDLFENRRDDLIDENSETVLQAAKMIWGLSFHEEFKQQFIENGGIDCLRACKFKDKPNVKQAIDGALWTLTCNSMDVNMINQTTSHVMLSYCTAEKDRMKQLADLLKTIGINVLMDEGQIDRNGREVRIEDVEMAAIMIVGISSQYKESLEGRTEAEFASRLNKKIIWLVVEDDYTPKGWLKALIGHDPSYNPWEDPQGFTEGATRLISHLQQILTV